MTKIRGDKMEKEKKIYVTKPYLPELETFEKYLERIWANGILTNKGPLYLEFLKKLSELFKNDNINLFCNGHNALECALKSLDMKPNGEIITTPFTFVSTTHAIVNSGFKPVFCDIKEDNLTIDEDKIEDLITENTVAILPVHVYGFPCNTKKIEEIAKKHNLKVIYDAAHAFGVEVGGESILNEGDISMVSFHATKLFHTIEGGMTLSKSPEIAKKQEMLQNFGISGYESVSLIGGNSKMNEFCAAMGLSAIDEIDKIIEKRKYVAEKYTDLLSDVEGIRLFPEQQEDVKSNYAYYPIVIDENEYGKTRDNLYLELMDNNIFARKYFYPLTSDMDCYKEPYPEFATCNLPVARYTADRVLTLPMYYDIKDEDIERVCKVLRKK